MLSTSNYPARRFGVRSAMPGYIAKKVQAPAGAVGGQQGPPGSGLGPRPRVGELRSGPAGGCMEGCEASALRCTYQKETQKRGQMWVGVRGRAIEPRSLYLNSPWISNQPPMRTNVMVLYRLGVA